MSISYDDYLANHISAVEKAGDWLLTHFQDKFGHIDEFILRTNLAHHDDSKHDAFEYHAYDQYFYGGNKSSKTVRDFNIAWLVHLHKNGHHWQYWVLIHDDEPIEALEMPIYYVIEMIADWWSFSYRSGNLYEIFDWYEKHKGGMILHPKTKELVENILAGIKEELDKE